MYNDKERVELRKKIAEEIKRKIVDTNARLDIDVQDDEEEEGDEEEGSSAKKDK